MLWGGILMGMYFVYIVKCADGSLYVGVTTDILRRVEEHNGGVLGARYTKSRRPVTLVYVETALGRSSAQKREAELKKLRRDKKLALIQHAEAPYVEFV